MLSLFSGFFTTMCVVFARKVEKERNFKTLNHELFRKRYYSSGLAMAYLTLGKNDNDCIFAGYPHRTTVASCYFPGSCPSRL